MEHLTLTETEFFRLISNPDSRTGLRTAYDEFTQRVIQLCLIPPESGHPVHALSCNTMRPCKAGAMRAN